MSIPSAITFGTSLNQGTLYYINDAGLHSHISVEDLFLNGRTVVFGGPAPFSRLDSQHAEQFEIKVEDFKSLGIDKVVAIYCQDAFVCQKFREMISQKAQSDSLRYYADGDGGFIMNYGMSRNFTNSGLGVRSERWAAVVTDGKVDYIEHDEFSVIDKTHPDNIIAWLKKS